MSNRKYTNFFSDIVLFSIGSLGSKILLFLLIPLYTSILSNSEYGIADLVYTIGDLILPFISLTIYNGLLRFGLAKEKRFDAIRCASLIFVFGSVLTILITPILGLYKSIAEWKWFLSFKIISSFALSNSLIMLKINEKTKWYAFVSILQAVLLVSCNLLFLIVYRQGIKGYLFSSIISSSISAIIAFIASNGFYEIKQSSTDRKLMKEMVLYSLPFIINDVSWWLINSSDKVMIEMLIGSSLLGIYTAASKIPSLINTVTFIFSQAWGIASIKEYDSTNDCTFYSTVFLAFSIVIVGFCMVLITITKPFMTIYVGNSFFEAWHFVPPLLTSAAFSAISTFSGSLLGALKKSSKLMLTTVISATINIIVNYIMITNIGIWGAVIGTVAAYLSVAILRMIAVKRDIAIDYNLKLSIPLAILLLVQSVLVGIDFYPYVVSFVVLLCYVFLIRKHIMTLLLFLKKIKNTSLSDC